MSENELGAIPTAPVPIPPGISQLGNGRRMTCVWLNQAGGRTFRIDDGPDASYVKWYPPHPDLDLAAEIARLSWAAPYLTVPRVLDHGRDGENSWLLTAAVDGTSAVSQQWLAQPGVAARAIGTGLRVMHDALPVAQCPFSWSIEHRAARAAGPIDPERLAQMPPVDRLVVCHGDACAPNTLLDANGNYSAHVDLGALGVADRWADLAVATYSLQWNYPQDLTGELLDAYGVDHDQQRIEAYRWLWDAT